MAATGPDQLDAEWAAAEAPSESRVPQLEARNARAFPRVEGSIAARVGQSR